MSTYNVHLGFNWNNAPLGSFLPDPPSRELYPLSMEHTDSSGIASFYRFAPSDILNIYVWDLTVGQTNSPPTYNASQTRIEKVLVSFVDPVTNTAAAPLAGSGNPPDPPGIVSGASVLDDHPTILVLTGYTSFTESEGFGIASPWGNTQNYARFFTTGTQLTFLDPGEKSHAQVQGATNVNGPPTHLNFTPGRSSEAPPNTGPTPSYWVATYKCSFGVYVENGAGGSATTKRFVMDPEVIVGSTSIIF